MKKVSNKSPYIIWLNLYEMFKIGKYQETDGGENDFNMQGISFWEVNLAKPSKRKNELITNMLPERNNTVQMQSDHLYQCLELD